MDPVTFEDLHHEHVRWLSEVSFWEEEIKFLEKLCHTMEAHRSNGFPVESCLNRLAHHDRMLKSMKNQIISHENFLREMIQEDGKPSDSNTLDHDHNRDHMRHFHESYKKLKSEIFKISHHALS